MFENKSKYLFHDFDIFEVVLAFKEKDNDVLLHRLATLPDQANRCIPLDNQQVLRQDMVYGKCECQHNTTGLNCERCEDFYNDLPWMPAIGTTTNACKRCKCNDHATRWWKQRERIRLDLNDCAQRGLNKFEWLGLYAIMVLCLGTENELLRWWGLSC